MRPSRSLPATDTLACSHENAGFWNRISSGCRVCCCPQSLPKSHVGGEGHRLQGAAGSCQGARGGPCLWFQRVKVLCPLPSEGRMMALGTASPTPHDPCLPGPLRGSAY